MKYNRFISALLSLVFIIGLPFNVFAADDKVLFSDAFDGSMKNWEVVRGNGFSSQKSHLVFENTAENLTSSVLVSTKSGLDNAEVDTDITPVKGNIIGLFFRYTDLNSH